MAVRSRYAIPTGIERISARAACSVRMSARSPIADDRRRPLVGRQSGQQGSRERLLAGQGPETRLRPTWNDGRVGPEEGRRAADDLPVGQRDVDRDVVSANPPRPRRMRVGLAEDGEPVQLGIPPRPAAATAFAFERSEDRFERDDRGDLSGRPLAQRRLEDRRRSPLVVRGVMSRSASPSRVPGVYAQTNRSFVSNGKTAAARWVASSPSSQARAAAVISSAAAVTR